MADDDKKTKERRHRYVKHVYARAISVNQETERMKRELEGIADPSYVEGIQVVDGDTQSRVSFSGLTCSDFNTIWVEIRSTGESMLAPSLINLLGKNGYEMTNL